jgi:hypothetical protein
MTKKLYRSAQGKTVDIGTLVLQNENVRAVGNMGVNARGDKINEYNNTIAQRTQQVKKQYDNQVRTNVSDDRPSDAGVGNRQAQVRAKLPPDVIKEPAPVAEAVDAAPANSAGVASALEKVRKLKQNKG